LHLFSDIYNSAAAKQVAEKLVESVSRGRIASGHDFSRADRATKGLWALAPVAFIFRHLQLRSG
jgi:hypothetical protein